jgi:NAD(P)H dehydrogenase (quinone)
MLVHIVYAHPSGDSFTHALLEAFVAGLGEAGHSHTISERY